jgi:TolB protein
MLQRAVFVLTAVVLSAAFAVPAIAQDPEARGVRIGLTYQPGSRPGLVVLPVRGEGGDSIQAIIQRDLDFGDRITVIGREGTSAAGAVGAANGQVNYGLWAQLGAAGVVAGTLTPGGVRVAVHDVAQRRVAHEREFSLPVGVNSPAWRHAVHGISDEIERLITGTRGIAQTRVAFVRAGRVYVVDSDGAGERALSESGALSPAWHPSGQYITYSQFAELGTNIIVHDLWGGSARRLAAAPRGLNMTPEFSPDGRSILFAHGVDAGTDLYMADAFAGGSARRITVSRGSDNVSPSFSPDGRRIAFTTGRLGHPEVYIVDVDGSNAELLTPFNFGDQNYRSNPAWSPDGRQVAFQSQIAGRFQIMVINLRDRTVRQLTSEASNEDPAWAPNGRHLIFSSTRTGTAQLFVMDVESGRTRQLTRAGGSRLPAWSGYLDRVQ